MCVCLCVCVCVCARASHVSVFSHFLKGKGMKKKNEKNIQRRDIQVFTTDNLV